VCPRQHAGSRDIIWCPGTTGRTLRCRSAIPLSNVGLFDFTWKTAALLVLLHLAVRYAF
jgi:hypothetical protein